MPERVTSIKALALLPACTSSLADAPDDGLALYEPDEPIRAGIYTLHRHPKDPLRVVFHWPRKDHPFQHLKSLDSKLRLTPFHVVDTKVRGWQWACNLTQGEELAGVDSKGAAVETYELRTEAVDVYNVEVGGSHTYVADGFLVHNKSLRLSPMDYPSRHDPWFDLMRRLCLGSQVRRAVQSAYLKKYN